MEVDVFEPGLIEICVAPEHREIDRRGEPLALVREDRAVHRVVHEARRDLADHAAAALTDQQRVVDERIAPQDFDLRRCQLR